MKNRFFLLLTFTFCIVDKILNTNLESWIFSLENHKTNSQWLASAIIVEPRASSALEYAVRRMWGAIPDQWVLVLIHSSFNREFVLHTFRDLLMSSHFHLWQLADASKNYSIFRTNCSNVELSNKTEPVQLRHRSLWESEWALGNIVYLHPAVYSAIPTEKYLIFQTDGMLCRKDDDRLLKYWDYDFVGAPWAWIVKANNQTQKLSGNAIPPRTRIELNPSHQLVVGGNGGFSWRSKSVMLQILNEYVPKHDSMDLKDWLVQGLHEGGCGGCNEDAFFTERVLSVGGHLPTLDKALEFSVETTFFPNPIGFHKPWDYLGKEQLEVLMSSCPYLSEAYKLSNNFL